MRLQLKWMAVLFVVALQFSFAQEKKVSGKVTDESGIPLPGATVLVKETSKGTQTDFDGNYSLSVEEGKTLVFSYVGMKSVEKVVKGGGNPLIVSAVLKVDAQELGAVVVTAYGTQDKASVAGSIKTIDSKEIAKSQAADVVQSLSGKAAGVQIKVTSGQPGSESSQVRFRGIGSISSSNDPLYVVDGIPYNGSISSIPSQDIESVTFLKDASANALYGSRGANGVVIITTKKGKEGKVSFSYDTKIGFNDRAIKDYDIIKDPREYYELEYRRLKLGAWVNDNTKTDAQLSTIASNSIVQNLGYNIFNVPNDKVIDPATGKVNPDAQVLYQDDWDKALFNTGIRQEHFLSATYGSDKLSSYMSINYLKDNGYVVNSGFDRVAARLNLDYKLSKYIKIGNSVSYAYTMQKVPQAGKQSGYFSNLFSWTRNAAPIFPIYARDRNGNIKYDADGNKIYDFGKGQTENYDGSKTKRVYIENMNPYATTLKNTQTNENHNLNDRAYLSVDFWDGFNFTYNIGYDMLASNRLRYGWEVGGDAAPYNGSITNGVRFSTTLTNQQLLSWKKSFGDHSFDILLGHESSDFNSKMIAGNKTNVVVSEKVFLANASKIGYLTGYNDSYQVEGYLSKLNYSYANKYFVNTSFRRDASSVFHPDRRWGNFYGVGLAWNITNENFFPKSDVINNLKLKASYGEQGNDNIYYPSYVNFDHRGHFLFMRNYKPYLTQYDIAKDANGDPTVTEAYIGNPDLKWEVSKNFNAGVELRLFNRLNIEAEYFVRGVSDMLYNFPLAPSSGIPSISRNIGDMQNRGFEVSLDLDILKGKDYNLNVWANATHYKNIITKLPNSFNSGYFRFVEGESAYTYYLREFVGVDEITGAGKWNKGNTDESTKKSIGDKTIVNKNSDATPYLLDKTANPDVYGGFGLNINYKNWSFSTGFAYQFGGYIYDGVYQELFAEGEGFGSSGHNFHKDVYNTWTLENKNAPLPRLTTADSQQFGSSDLFLVKADYISWENASISYTFDFPELSKIGVNNITMSLLANNLWLLSKRQGLDPRSMRLGAYKDNGGTYNDYSLLRTISVGLNAKF